MNNLTNKERARIFAMYLGAKTYYQNRFNRKSFMGVDLDGAVWVKDGVFLGFVDDIKLQLTPLSKITDEHAIEVAKICKPDVVWNITKKDLFNRIVLESNNYRLCIWFVDYYCIEFEYCDTPSHFSSISDVIDRLRKLGYALPYKGKSLFDLGIAIDKTTLK